MFEYPCKRCNERQMIMGYCDTHWQEVKATWTPAEMGQPAPSLPA
jgi:hypothetical protein